jgi:CHASE2 domain-containing sensor protein
LPEAPYVGLDYFLEEDAELFFGRDAERRRVIGNLRASRFTLLYAESGVGKSSLLHAGVSARLRQLAARSAEHGGSARYVPLVFSGWQDGSTEPLIAALEEGARATLGESIELAPRRDTLEHAIEDVAKAADATLLVILDQFEDHFLYQPSGRDGFDDELAHCVNHRDLRAHFLLSVREDAYPLIGQRFKARIPDVYGNFLRLDFLEEDAAREAVVEPLRAFNRGLPDGDAGYDVEPELVDAVIEQVRRGRVALGEEGAPDRAARGTRRVETAYLQLVMRRLWDEEVAAGSRRLRAETLERLGGANTIVHAHLDDVMERMAPDQRDAAAAAFRFLLTSGGRKIALSTDELREFSEIDGAPLEPALEHLERARILRPIPALEPGGARRREIYHDVLAPAILEWRRRHVVGRRLAHERARSRRLGALAIALASIVAAMGLYLWSPEPLRRLELATVDARYSLRGTGTPDPGVVMIAVDDATLRALTPDGRPPLPRAAHALLLRRLQAVGPSVVAVDVEFVDPKTEQEDAALLSAIRSLGDRVVLAYGSTTAEIAPLPDGTRRMRPVLLGRANIADETGARLGYAGVPEDPDSRNRRADYQVAFGRAKEQPTSATALDLNAPDVTAPTFAFAAADVVRNGDLLKTLDDLPTAERRAWGGQSERTTWIDFRGPAGTVPTFSALDVLRGEVPSGAFRDKAVVIGLVSRGTGDEQETPLDEGRPMPGVELQANALSTMLRDSPLQDANRLVEILTIIALGVVPMLAVIALRGRWAVAATVAVAVAFLVIAVLAFNGGWVLVVAPPLIALALAAAGLLAVHAVRSRRARAT